jgi:RNA:NAD 2'-phosphotransferase (TPT1/KptA family)
MNRIFVNTKAVQKRVNNAFFSDTVLIVRKTKDIELRNISMVRNPNPVRAKNKIPSIYVTDTKNTLICNCQLYFTGSSKRYLTVKEKQKKRYKYKDILNWDNFI